MAAQADSVGSVINQRYRIKDTLGRGGMGEVLLVEDEWDGGRPLALKRVRRDRLDSLPVSILRREFLAVAHLRHPNLARAYDFGRDWETGDYFFTYEYVDGVRLHKALAETGMDPLVEAFIQTARVLDFLHSHGFVHGDIKPDNLLVQPLSGGGKSSRSEFRIKLIDFGLTVRKKKAPSDRVVGTAYYVAPEVLRGSPADRRADLYSLGVVFYHLSCGSRPFKGASNQEIVQQHLEVTPPPPRALNPAVPVELSDLTMRLLAKDPDARPANASQVVESLSALRSRPVPLETADTSMGYLDSIPLVGRDEELRTLLAATFFSLSGDRNEPLKAAHVSGKRVPKTPLILIQGPPGVGKSRLASELKLFSQAHGILTIHVRKGELVEATARKLAVEPRIEAIIKRLTEIGRKQRILLIAEKFGRCSREGAAFLRVLIRFTTIGANEVPLVVALTANSEGRSRHFEELIKKPDIRRHLAVMRISPLEGERIEELVDRAFPENRFSPEFKRKVAEASSGYPRIAVEILRKLLSHRLIVRSRDGWEKMGQIEPVLAVRRPQPEKT